MGKVIRMDNFGARLRSERERMGLSQTAFAELAGASKPSQVRYEKGERYPDGLYLERIATKGVDILYILTGERNTPHRDVPLSLVEDDFVRVERFDVALSAGPGRDGDNAPPLAPVAFRLDWMNRMGLRAADCVVVGVSGDSMEPVLHDGDMVMLDRRHGAIRPRAIYAAVDVSGDVVVKRLERIDAGLLLHSDNPDYPTLFRSAAEAEQVQIIGRAVWSGHTFDRADGLTRPKTKKTGLEPFEHVWL